MSTGQHTALISTGYVPVGVVTAISVQKALHEEIDFCAWARTAVASPSTNRKLASSSPADGFKPGSVPVSPELLKIVSAPSVALSMVMRDLQTRCLSLGANGVLGLRLEIKQSIKSINRHAVQYQMTGTAVRAPEHVGWFTAHLSGDEFAKLLRAGWMPVSMIAGTAVGLRHEVIPGRRRLGAAARLNAEVQTWTDVMQRTRAEARSDLSAQLKAKGADGALLASEKTESELHSCPLGRGKDRMVRTTLLATAVTELAPGSAGSAGPILSTIRTGL